MKSLKHLIPQVPLLLFQVTVSKAGSRLLDACDESSLDISDGVLSGECHVAGNTAVTSVDLDQCLGWSSRAGHLGLFGDTTGLAPAKDGAFTDHCSPCYVIKRGEHNQNVAQLLCNCGPDDSDISIEYILDLEDLVTVTEDGCLECMGATGKCTRVAPSRTSRDASIKSDPGQELLHWFELEAKRVPCEEYIRNPKFATTGTRTNTKFDDFNLIEGNIYVWRIHFVFHMATFNISRQLSNVYQFCNPYGDDIDKSSYSVNTMTKATFRAKATTEKSDWATSLPIHIKETSSSALANEEAPVH
ncbi:hypothetical protein Daus18300_011138 [Diaporthe australafricana]|uniref:Cyanovirin-N domain-containing protein n=1 Tax=Diaporthe australafricana TaxID=127596 RepID=A0ABR3W7S7_9PEZI